VTKVLNCKKSFCVSSKGNMQTLNYFIIMFFRFNVTFWSQSDKAIKISFYSKYFNGTFIFSVDSHLN